MTWSRCPAGLRRDSAVCFLMPKFLIRELVADMLSVLCCSKAVLRFSKLLRCTNWATIIFSGFCFLGMWDPWVACLAALVVSTGRACQQVWQEDLAFSFTTFGSVFSLTCNSVPYEARMAIASFSVLSTIRRPEQYRLQISPSCMCVIVEFLVPVAEFLSWYTVCPCICYYYIAYVLSDYWSFLKDRER